MHNGGAVAQQNSALLQGGTGVLVAGINAASDRRVSKDQNATRVKIAELQNEREADENAVLLEALRSNDAQTEALVEQSSILVEQNGALTELINLLTEEATSEGEEGEEVVVEGDL